MSHLRKILRRGELSVQEKLACSDFLDFAFLTVGSTLRHRFSRFGIVYRSNLRLRFALATINKMMVGRGLGNELLISTGDGVWVFDGLVALSTDGTNRYFQKGGFRSQARIVADTLRRLGIEPRWILDIGANYGEFSLVLADEFPESSIIAVEPSRENSVTLQKNLSRNVFAHGRIEVLVLAVSSSSGSSFVTSGRGSENVLVSSKSPGIRLQEVQTLSLNDLVVTSSRQFDFVKIDIEGSEPLIADDLSRLASSIKAVLIEVGSKNSSSERVDVVKKLSRGWLFFSDEGRQFSLDDVIKAVEESSCDFLLLSKQLCGTVGADQS